MSRVSVFLAEHDPQLETYLGYLPDYGVTPVVLSLKGIHSTRKHIVNNHYAPGTPVLQIDDDLHYLAQVHGKKLHPAAIHHVALHAFTETAARNLWAWGVCPVPNHFFMTEGRMTEGLRFLIGTFVGQYVRPGHPVHEMSIQVKEDYETSLRHWWYDGAVLRLDGYAAKADHYTPGGCAGYRDVALEERAVQTLLDQWPGLVRRNTRRKNAYAEVLLATRGRGQHHTPMTPPPGLAL